jgi:hypothetical protein
MEDVKWKMEDVKWKMEHVIINHLRNDLPGNIKFEWEFFME